MATKTARARPPTCAVGEGWKPEPAAGMKVAVMTSRPGAAGAVVGTVYAPVALTATAGSATPLLVTCGAQRSGPFEKWKLAA